MNLLFDQNISFKVSKALEDIFPGAKHVSDVRMDGRSDIEIWEYAKVQNSCIVSFDNDFADLSILRKFPPKIILLKTGNTTNLKLQEILRGHYSIIRDFLADNELSILEIK
jgi:predicted nuclease of predicted toxin-antitoxin system